MRDDGAGPSLDALARLAHEFRSPLTAVLGFAELLRESLGGAIPEQAQGHLDDLTVAAERLRRLADEMVSLGDPGAGAPPAVAPLDALVATALRQAGPAAAARGVRLEAGPATDLVASADAPRLAQALDALIDNAIRHGRPGGTVRVLVRLGDAPGEVAVEVADDGPGLEAGSVMEALRPYGRPVGAQPGAPPGGLGLTIAHELAASQGGRLEIDTAPGEGFRARLALRGG